MKALSTLVLGFALQASSGAMAAAIPDLTCTTIDTTSKLEVTVKFSSPNVIDEISTGGSVVWKSAPGKFDQGFSADSMTLARGSQFLQMLGLHLGPSVGTLDKLEVTLITSAPDSGTPTGTLPTMERQIDKISDDGAGIAFMNAKDVSGASVGTVLFVGWAGAFNNCR